jgi:hypothetical protein
MERKEVEGEKHLQIMSEKEAVSRDRHRNHQQHHQQKHQHRQQHRGG